MSTPCIHGVTDHTLCARCQRILTIRESNARMARRRSERGETTVPVSPLPGLGDDAPTVRRPPAPRPEVIAAARQAAWDATVRARKAEFLRRWEREAAESQARVALTRAALQDLRRGEGA